MALYMQCKQTQIVQVTKEKAGKSVTMMLSVPVGLSILPYEGGLMDQPYRLMHFFSAFEDGEQQAFSDKIR